MNPQLLAICQQFTDANIKRISSLGNGLINETLLVESNCDTFVLQRINSHVFPNAQLIMENMQVLTQIFQKQKQAQLTLPELIFTTRQATCFTDEQHNIWRALTYIADTESRETITNAQQAQQIGFALAHFHRLLNDVDRSLFHDTLPDFHITPRYYKHYQRIKNQLLHLNSSPESQFCQQFIEDFIPYINSLEHAKQRGHLKQRITHGDPKLNNFLFDRQTHRVISLVDLDTVKPGLIHYDIADCLRSCCHLQESNQFDLQTAQFILAGYLNEARDFLTTQDYAYLYPAIRLIPFELGLRFFSDYLQGNPYFKTTHPNENLDRAIAQFKLCEDIQRQKKAIEALIIS